MHFFTIFLLNICRVLYRNTHLLFLDAFVGVIFIYGVKYLTCFIIYFTYVMIVSSVSDEFIAGTFGTFGSV